MSVGDGGTWPVVSLTPEFTHGTARLCRAAVWLGQG